MVSDPAGESVLERSRAAAARGEWGEAFALLGEADSRAALRGADLGLLADVAYAAGRLDVTIDAWERAYAEGLRGGDRPAAAGAALRIAMHLLMDTALMAPIRGWLGRADALLEGLDETPVHAWLAVVHNYERLLSGDFETARTWARRAIEVGSRLEPAAAAVARVAEARSLILDGDVRQGLALLDEAGVAAVSGELDPIATGVVYCELLCALQGLAQYDQADQWSEAMERWSRASAIGSFHGRCRVHRAEILRLRGACREAESEALLACDELRPYLRREFGWPLTELGRIRLQRGDLEGAEEAFVAAHQAGWDPHPGLALVRLARGDVEHAAAAIRDALERPSYVPSKEFPPNSDLRRAPLLAAQVEIGIAAGQLDVARAAAGELGRIATRFESKALAATPPSRSAPCCSPRAIRPVRAVSSIRPRTCGARSARRTRRRTPGSAWPTRTTPRTITTVRSSSAARRTPSSNRSARGTLHRGGPTTRVIAAPSRRRCRRRRSASSVARATTGRSASRTAPSACATSRACATWSGCSPSRDASSTSSTS